MNASHRPAPDARPLRPQDIDRLQAMLDALPTTLEPLDTCMLDGYLCGVLLQPKPVPAERWLPFVTDIEGRALPTGCDARSLLALVRRRHAELAEAIARRQWFDPWVFELENEAGAAPPAQVIEAVVPWVAGFAVAMEQFPGLMRLSAPAMLEPLALLYRHLDADDLEDADALLAEIESLEPPADLAQAVEELVRATLLLADVSLPRAEPPAPPRSARRAPKTHRG